MNQLVQSTVQFHRGPSMGDAAEALRPELMFIGDLRIVLPMPSEAMPLAELTRLNRSAAAIRTEIQRGDRKEANRLAVALEERLGVKPAHHVALLEAEDEWEQGIETLVGLAAATATTPPPPPKRKGKAPPPPPAPASVLESDEISESRLALWEQHKANLNHPNEKTRNNAWDELGKIERDMISGRERKWLKRAMGETLALAKARGEEVEGDSQGGNVRILSRGGIDAAARSGHLDDIERGPGEAWARDDIVKIAGLYRDCYERMEGQSTPDRSGAGGGGSRQGPQHSLLHCAEVLGILRGGQSALTILALDLICGLDMSINVSSHATGAHRITMRRRLRLGLGHAASNWHGRPKEMRTPSREEFSLVDAAVRAAEKAAR